MRTFVLAVALVLAAGSPALAKKHKSARGRAAVAKKAGKRGKKLVAMQKSRPLKVAAAHERVASAPPQVAALPPTPVAPAPTPAPAPVEHRAAVSQSWDDGEVPGTRMRR
jgi:hypothetical protein